MCIHLSEILQMRIWSLSLIKSDFKCVYILVKFFMYFNYILGECHCWWTRESRGHMKPGSTVDFGWFVAFWEHRHFLCLKLIEIVILWVYFTIPLIFCLFRHCCASLRIFVNYMYFVYLRITGEDLVPEAKQKYPGIFETRKSGNKSSSGEIVLNIRTPCKSQSGTQNWCYALSMEGVTIWPYSEHIWPSSRMSCNIREKGGGSYYLIRSPYQPSNFLRDVS